MVHDSCVVEDILGPDNTALDVRAYRAYRSAEIETKPKGLKARTHRKGYCNKSLSEREKRGNKIRPKVCAYPERVFGVQGNGMGGTLVRAKARIRLRAPRGSGTNLIVIGGGRAKCPFWSQITRL